MVVTLLLIAVVILAMLVASLIYSNFELKQQLELIDREQHSQNKEIMDLMKDDQVIKEMLLQHIEILKYLCEQDPKLNSSIMLMGKPGIA